MEKELRLLMIEDVPHDAELEVRELKRAGMRVVHHLVETENAFRDALEKFRPDLIISDFSMPHFDGMWALTIARERAPDVPFLFVSGTIGEEYAIRALKNGATDYVLKNNLVRLPAAVERALQDKEIQAARRSAEVEIKQQRAFLRQIIDLDRSLIFAKDQQGRFVLINQAVAELFGSSVEAMLGKTLGDFGLDKAQAERLNADDREIMETLRDKFIAEDRIVDGTGREHWFQIVKRPIIGADGKAHMVLGVATDITERKSQELKIARLSRIHEVLSGINSAIVRIRDRGELFREACRIAVEHGKFGMAWIGTLDAAAQEVTPVAWAGLEASEFLGGVKSTIRDDLPQGRGVLAQAIKLRKPVFDNDIAINPEVGGRRRAEAIRRGYRSVVVLPLIAEGEVVGSMSLFARELNFFDEAEIKLLTELAGDVSFALEHIVKEEKLERLSRIRAVSAEINAAIVRIRERKGLLDETCRIAVEHGKFDLVWVGTVDEDRKEVTAVAWTGFSPEAARAVNWASIATTQGSLGEAMRTRVVSVRDDIGVQYSGGRLRQEALARGFRSNLCLPLVVDGRVVALIVLFASGVGFFNRDELALLEELAADVSYALQAIEKQEKLEYLSYYDTLTGLPNRHLFIDRLSQQMRAREGEERMVALILLNLERFRNMNETLGRHGGDDLLRQIAGRLEHAFRGKDSLAYFGADNFAVVIRGVRDAADIAHAVESQVLGCLAEPFEIGDRRLRATARAGVALFPADGGDADTLFKNAEAALTKARASGERYLFYAPQMNARVAEQLKLENDLRNALLQEQYVLYYQPRFDFVSGGITGLEALIRWKHPERGMVSPGEFIPILEETGMIIEVGRWALKRAALDHAGWSAAGLKPPRIAVNVSPVQLRRRDFIDYVKDALAAVERSSDRLDIEITESMLMEDIEGSIAKLEAVQAMGLQVALDDFGTGYSSLSYLARLPIDSLKIDRSFITQMPKSPEQMAIVSTVISLARALNLKVVAEGVETEEQANLLRLLRCDEVQGYLYGKPAQPEEIVKLLPRA